MATQKAGGVEDRVTETNEEVGAAEGGGQRPKRAGRQPKKMGELQTNSGVAGAQEQRASTR